MTLQNRDRRLIMVEAQGKELVCNQCFPDCTGLLPAMREVRECLAQYR